jgi:hypothetical protein
VLLTRFDEFTRKENKFARQQCSRLFCMKSWREDVFEHRPMAVCRKGTLIPSIMIGGLTAGHRTCLEKLVFSANTAAGLSRVGIGNENDQVSKGHLVDALACTGDEGRDTLR